MKLPKDKKVYVIGMSGIEEELREEGISFIGGTVCIPSSAPTHYSRNARTRKTVPLNHLPLQISHSTRMSKPFCAAWTSSSIIPSYQRHSNTSHETLVVNSWSQTKTAHSRAQMVSCPALELSVLLCASRWIETR